MIPAKDISRWQGAYSETGEPIVMVKISGGDVGLYVDPQAASNYNQVIAHGHAFGGYHFAGAGDPVAEANFFVNAMMPLNTGEVPALDWEVGHPNPPAWCNTFIDQVRKGCGNPNQGGLIYMNLATLNAHDWSLVLSKWGLWLADWTGDPSGATVNTDKTVVMLQYNDGPTYDRDEWYGSIEQFKAYGWQPATAPAPAPAPEPSPSPTPPEPPVLPTPPTPEPIPPTDTPPPVPEPPVEPTPGPTPPPSTTPVPPPQNHLKAELLAIVIAIAALIGSLLTWLHS